MNVYWWDPGLLITVTVAKKNTDAMNKHLACFWSKLPRLVEVTQIYGIQSVYFKFSNSSGSTVHGLLENTLLEYWIPWYTDCPKAQKLFGIFFHKFFFTELVCFWCGFWLKVRTLGKFKQNIQKNGYIPVFLSMYWPFSADELWLIYSAVSYVMKLTGPL